MSNQGPAQEPTMEEILASIRRIISEDSGVQEAPAEDYEPAQPAYDDEPEEEVTFEEDEVIELSEALPDEQEQSYEEPEPAPAYQPRHVVGTPLREAPQEVYEAEPEFDPEPVYEPERVRAQHYAEPDYSEPDGDIAFEEPPMNANTQASRLISSATEQAAASSFGMLANSMLSSSGSGRTLEDVVGEYLRPMLKQWLDENLPGLVEKLVREEIERVSRRGR